MGGDIPGGNFLGKFSRWEFHGSEFSRGEFSYNHVTWINLLLKKQHQMIHYDVMLEKWDTLHYVEIYKKMSLL